MNNPRSLLSNLLGSLFRRRPPGKPPQKPPGFPDFGQFTKPPPAITPVTPITPINLTDLVSNSNNLIPANNARFTQGQIGSPGGSIGCLPLSFNQEMFDISARNDAADLIRRHLGHWVEPDHGTWGQCAAAGVYSAQDAVDSWMRSAAHREIMLDPRYKYAGLHIDLRTGFATLTVRVESRDIRGFIRP